jgi:hypothetical protein
MSRKIKLIWDFRGPNAQKTAEHHCIHLDEFTAHEKLSFHEVNTEKLTDFYTIAYITIDERDMPIFRDTLKPHRGEIAP